jgi:uncharacterized membrane protein
MAFLHALASLTWLDGAALALLLSGWWCLGWLTEHPPAGRPSVSVLMKAYRHDWMREFVTRQPRIFDATLIESLRQGTTFLASTCMIAIGGGAALIGNADRLTGLAGDLSVLNGPVALWQAKVLLVLLFLTNAVLKFIWAHRLFGYNAILMAAVPNDADDPTAYPRAAQAAEINIHAARNFNRGLLSVYFALGSLAWLAGPEALLAATLATIWVAWRREFASHSRQVLLGGPGRD